MKWGKRKSFDAEIEERHGPATPASTGTLTKKQRKVAGKTETEDGKEVARMSDKELRERINRINMEQQYEKLTTPSYPPVKNGMDYVNAAFTIGAKANQAYQLWNSPVAKLGRDFVKTQQNNRRSNIMGIAG